MVTHRPHKPEIPGPNPGLPQPQRRIQQSFSFENSLAHLVEHLFGKQSVIGSSPIIISLMRLVYGSVAQLVEAVGWSPTRRWSKSIQTHQLQELIEALYSVVGWKQNETLFHIFLKSMEQKTITYEEFFTPGFFKFAFLPHSFLIVCGAGSPA